MDSTLRERSDVILVGLNSFSDVTSEEMQESIEALSSSSELAGAGGPILRSNYTQLFSKF